MLTLEEQTNSSISLSLSPASFESDIAKASQLWEQATDLLLQAGRLFQGVKASTKRKFTKLLLASHLEKTQVNKLIKAASVADEIPTVVAQQLALHQILQLGQPKNRDALEAIQNDDTQITVAQKIKEHRKLQQQHKQPTKAYTRLSEKEEAIPFCLLEGYEFEFSQQPNIQQQLPQSLKEPAVRGQIEEMEAGTGSSSDDKPTQQLDNTCKANEMNQHRQGSDIYEQTADTGSSSDDEPTQQLYNTYKANEMNQHRQGSDIYEQTADTGSSSDDEPICDTSLMSVSPKPNTTPPEVDSEQLVLLGDNSVEQYVEDCNLAIASTSGASSRLGFSG
ncbi:hypothetical protein BLD44_007210 [Mastigocladus laminosus UU774]|nr:hypothetical protein BLD44_007210 [Mastigocladus laminosus UU774]